MGKERANADVRVPAKVNSRLGLVRQSPNPGKCKGNSEDD